MNHEVSKHLKKSIDCSRASQTYYLSFRELLRSQEEDVLSKDDQFLFYSYCLSRQIQDLIALWKQNRENWLNFDLGQMEKFVLQNEAVKNYISRINQKIEGDRRRQPKDRKTSFYRTILKHLKRVTKQSDKFGKGKKNQLFIEVQKKLSKNTIACEDIQKLVSLYEAQIVSYLQSPQIYQDILLVNKSKTNKAFYLLHLASITLETKRGRLSSYPFFVRASLVQEVKKIVKIFSADLASELSNSKSKAEKDIVKIHSFMASSEQESQQNIYSVLNLSKFSQNNYTNGPALQQGANDLILLLDLKSELNNSLNEHLQYQAK